MNITLEQALTAQDIVRTYLRQQDERASQTVRPLHPPVPWYDWAKSKIGTKEIPGSKSNAEILGWMQEAFSWASDDSSLAWCGIFVKEALESTGYPYVKGYASARAWLNYGEPVEVGHYELGDIVVFWRGSRDSWKGHVGFYAGRDGDQIKTLGGNQSNSVSIANQPAYKLLGVRRPDLNA